LSIFISFSKWTPHGLFARSLLIIVLPIAIMQILVTYLFFDLHWGQVSRTLSEAAAGDVSYITTRYLADPTDANFAILKHDAEARLRLSVELRPGAELPTSSRNALIPAFDRTLRRALEGSVSQRFWFDTTRYPDYVDIRVKVPQGILRYLAYRDRVFASTGGIFLLWLTGATMILGLVSVLFIRGQVKPMERLADAAERFGLGEVVPLKPAGSREIRRATHAFLDMRARIGRHIEQRTNILAGVSHDLRTPLTRLKLELAMLNSTDATKDMQNDIKQMEEMLEEYLTFARGEWVEETELIELNQIAKSCFDDAKRTGANIVSKDMDTPIRTMGRGASIKRSIANLVSNATSFGSHVEISVSHNNKYAFVHVDDNGPGIEPSQYDEALNPFSRLDPSRNQNRNGVGLGLSIARDVARSHGGDIIMAKSALGGLRVSLKLPLKT
jgi:two-component system osmolarity sensor histidine kinase EnvZ